MCFFENAIKNIFLSNKNIIFAASIEQKYSKMKLFSQIIALVVCVGIGLVATGVVGVGAGLLMKDEGGMLHATMWGQNLLLMIGAPLGWAYFVYVLSRECYARKIRYAFDGLFLTRVPWKFMLYTACLILLSIPLSEAMDVVSLHFPWPEAIRESCEKSFIDNQHILLRLLQPTGFWGNLELFLLMCFFTAIGEEMMFRGALLGCFVKGGHCRWHLSIWIVGFVFALIHFEMMGFLSRWLLGSMLGYLVYWSRSLWPSVLAHCMNNTFALITYKLSTEEELLTMERGLSFPLYVVAISFVCTVVLLGRMRQIRCTNED